MPVFTTFYSIPIPEPLIKGLQQLAQFSTPEGIFDVFWVPKMDQVVIRYGNDWYIQPNARIEDSLSTLICCNTYDLHANGLFLFDREYRHGKAADEYMEKKLLECEWSDYAHDKMVFQANIDVDGLEYDTWDSVE